MSSMQPKGSFSAPDPERDQAQKGVDLVRVRAELIESYLRNSDLSRAGMAQQLNNLKETFRLDSNQITAEVRAVINDLALSALTSNLGCLALVPKKIGDLILDRFPSLSGDPKLASRLIEAGSFLFDHTPNIENFKLLIELTKNFTAHLLQGRLGALNAHELKGVNRELLSTFLATERIGAAAKRLLESTADRALQTTAITSAQHETEPKRELKMELAHLLLGQAVHLKRSCIPPKKHDTELELLILHKEAPNSLMPPLDRPVPSKQIAPDLELALHQHNAALLSVVCKITGKPGPREYRTDPALWREPVIELFNSASAFVNKASSGAGATENITAEYTTDTNLLISASRACLEIAKARLRYTDGATREESCVDCLKAMNGLFSWHDRTIFPLAFNEKDRVRSAFNALETDLASCRLDLILRKTDFNHHYVFEALRDQSDKLRLLALSIENHLDKDRDLQPTLLELSRFIISIYIGLSLANDFEAAHPSHPIIHQKAREYYETFLDFLSERIKKRIQDPTNAPAVLIRSESSIAGYNSDNKADLCSSIARDIALFEQFIDHTEGLATERIAANWAFLVRILKNDLEALYVRYFNLLSFDDFLADQTAIALQGSEEWYPNFRPKI
jgi:hypothetical protein